MAVALVNKVMDMLGLGTEAEEEEELYEENTEIEEEAQEEKSFFGKKKNIIPMPQVQSVKMVITQPTSFEQAEEVCNYLKEKKSIVLNLEYVNKDVARRIVDFMSGAVQALDGYIQKVSNSIFLVAPSNYDISSDLAREEIKNKVSVSWLKNG